jgi:hypothetical protein
MTITFSTAQAEVLRHLLGTVTAEAIVQAIGEGTDYELANRELQEAEAEPIKELRIPIEW